MEAYWCKICSEFVIENYGVKIMGRIRVMLIGLTMALVGATTADATVIYNWHTTGPGTYLTTTGGELVITDTAYRSGSIDEEGQRSNSPVLWVSLAFNSTVEGEPVAYLYVQPRLMGGMDGPLPFVSSLSFNNDGTVSGYMFLYGDDRSQEVELGGSGLWGVYNYGTDNSDISACSHGPTCDGGTGYWQFSRVPEPPVWAMFGLGVLGLFSLLRLRRKA